MGTFSRFLLLGALSTLIDYALFSLALQLGADYVFAIVLGYASGLWANFTLGRRYVFTGGKRISQTHREFVAVALVALGGLLLNIGIVKLFSYGWLGLDPQLSRLIAIGIVLFWNYFMRKLFIYH